MGEQIEISREMIWAGVAALQTDQMEGDDSALVAAVYIAMASLAARPRSPELIWCEDGNAGRSNRMR